MAPNRAKISGQAEDEGEGEDEGEVEDEDEGKQKGEDEGEGDRRKRQRINGKASIDDSCPPNGTPPLDKYQMNVN